MVILCAVMVAITARAEYFAPAMELTYSEKNTVLSMVFADWDEDSVADRAALVKEFDTQDYATLVVDLSSTASNAGQEVTIKFDDFAWDGIQAGTRASLSLSGVGSLIVNSGNSSVGRDRWRHRLYIAYRRKNLVVAGFDYSWRDTLTDISLTCDVNLLAGVGYKNDVKFEFDTHVIELGEWNDEKIRKLCES